jgi:hypothetical protein
LDSIHPRGFSADVSVPDRALDQIDDGLARSVMPLNDEPA